MGLGSGARGAMRVAQLHCFMCFCHPYALVSAADLCTDIQTECKIWASEGECKKNSAYMWLNCPKSCKTCEYAAKRRAITSGEYSCENIGDDSIEAGGIAARMEAMLNMKEYSPRLLSKDPPVMMLETFIDEDFAASVLRVGGHDFQRSLAGFDDGHVPSRTSSTSWCNVPTCEDSAVMERFKNRITTILDCPMLNTEHLQVLRYEVGQFYKSHHDQNSPVDSPPGPRVWTFFTYLSEVDEGGETYFPYLNLTVTPKTGSAIVWPSVRNENIFEDELRTEHEAMPVRAGVKFAANFWTHLRDFQTPHGAHCGTTPVRTATERRKAIEAARVANGGAPDGLMNAAISGVRPEDPRLRQPYRNVDKRGKMPKEEL